MMDRIESQLQLPPNAYELTEYGRYYARDGERVVAVYLAAGGEVRAGERRWVADKRGLPIYFDGGCDVINIVYDLSTEIVEQSFCDGVA